MMNFTSFLAQTSNHYNYSCKWIDEGANIFAADLTLRTPLLRQFLSDAGVNFRAPENCAVFEDEKLLGFFPRYDVQFVHKFDGYWRNVVTGETVIGEVTISIREKKLAIFEKLFDERGS